MRELHVLDMQEEAKGLLGTGLSGERSPATWGLANTSETCHSHTTSHLP